MILLNEKVGGLTSIIQSSSHAMPEKLQESLSMVKISDTIFFYYAHQLTTSR